MTAKPALLFLFCSLAVALIVLLGLPREARSFHAFAPEGVGLIVRGEEIPRHFESLRACPVGTILDGAARGDDPGRFLSRVKAGLEDVEAGLGPIRLRWVARELLSRECLTCLALGDGGDLRFAFLSRVGIPGRVADRCFRLSRGVVRGLRARTKVYHDAGIPFMAIRIEEDQSLFCARQRDVLMVSNDETLFRETMGLVGGGEARDSDSRPQLHGIGFSRGSHIQGWLDVNHWLDYVARQWEGNRQADLALKPL